MSGIYPRTITAHRPRTVAGVSDQIGLTGYSGVTESTAGTDAQGVTVLFTGLACSIQAKQSGRKKDSSLPQDAVFAPTWVIIFPPGASPAKGTIRDRDFIVDDEGYRYEVAQAYWNLMGYQLICIRLEA